MERDARPMPPSLCVNWMSMRGERWEDHRRATSASTRARGPPMAVEFDEGTTESGAVRGAVRDTRESIASVFRNPSLRRIQLAGAGSMIGDWAYSTAGVVWVYGVGGA